MTGAPPPPARRMTRAGWLSLAAVVIAAAVLHALWRDNAAIGTDISQQTSLDRLLSDRTSPTSGPSEAAISLIVFTDYQCPACRAAHPGMIEAAREAGDVRIVYRDLPIFGPVSETAARVALASREQGLYPEVHNAFMRDRRRLEVPVMREIVERLGGDWTRIERALANDAGIEEQLQANRADALRLGIAGTPGYLVGPYLVTGGLDKAEFEQVFAQARSAAAAR